MVDSSDDLLGQDTDLTIIGVLVPHLAVRRFVPPAVYPAWPLSFAENLVPEMRRLGYRHLVAIQRTHGDGAECVRLAPSGFTANDWGNLLFIRDDVYAAAAADLHAWVHGCTDRFHGAEEAPRVSDSTRRTSTTGSVATPRPINGHPFHDRHRRKCRCPPYPCSRSTPTGAARLSRCGRLG